MIDSFPKFRNTFNYTILFRQKKSKLTPGYKTLHKLIRKMELLITFYLTIITKLFHAKHFFFQTTFCLKNLLNFYPTDL